MFWCRFLVWCIFHHIYPAVLNNTCDLSDISWHLRTIGTHDKLLLFINQHFWPAFGGGSPTQFWCQHFWIHIRVFGFGWSILLCTLIPPTCNFQSVKYFWGSTLRKFKIGRCQHPLFKNLNNDHPKNSPTHGGFNRRKQCGKHARYVRTGPGVA